MAGQVVIFVPQNPYPLRSGSDRRILEIIRGFCELGCGVTVLSTALPPYSQWPSYSFDALQALGVRDVHIYVPTAAERIVAAGIKGWFKIVGRELPLDSPLYPSADCRRWFTQMLENSKPNTVLMNYARWDSLIDHTRFRKTFRVMETHDLMTLNVQMWRALQRNLPRGKICSGNVSEDVIKEDFFDSMGLRADAREYGIYDQYDVTIAISEQETMLIRDNTHSTNVLYLPMTEKPPTLHNQYNGPALFTTGPNPFNVQGFLYLARKVLPSVRRMCPGFHLHVTGSCCERVYPEKNVELRGFLPDLQAAYASARFAVCPVFGGTGQQVKIVEAMAHGVPVIALRAAAERSPMQHGVNGFIANNAEEFAEYICMLWSDSALCRQLGEAARNMIASEFSEERLFRDLSSLVHS